MIPVFEILITPDTDLRNTNWHFKMKEKSKILAKLFQYDVNKKRQMKTYASIKPTTQDFATDNTKLNDEYEQPWMTSLN